MIGRRRERARWMLVVTFAAAMAWVEAACVYYLRVMVDRVERRIRTFGAGRGLHGSEMAECVQ